MKEKNSRKEFFKIIYDPILETLIVNHYVLIPKTPEYINITFTCVDGTI